MASPSTDTLRRLVQIEGPDLVSIYLPMIQAGPETRQNPLRLKSALAVVREDLRSRGRGAHDTDLYLEPLSRLVDDHDFWQHQGRGLALFLCPDEVLVQRAALEFEALSIVGPRFHLKPLLQLVHGDGRFHLLALSPNRIRLLEGSRQGAVDVTPEAFPPDAEDALGHESPLPSLQFHGGSPGRRPVYHGHGSGEEHAKDRLLRFMRIVDGHLRDAIVAETTPPPLVLAAVDHLYPIFREATRHPNLLEDRVTGNPDELSVEELHRAGWAIVEPLFQAAREEVAATIVARAAQGGATAALEPAVKAAFEGRIEALFVAVGVRAWGRYEPERHAVTLLEDDRGGGSALDLLDLAAGQTLLRGGAVYAVAPEEMPTPGPIAALMRY